MGIANVLKQDQLAILSVGAKTPVRMFGEARRALPHRHQPDGIRRWICRGELENLWPRRPAIRFGLGRESRVGRKEHRAIPETRERGWFAGPALGIGAHTNPTIAGPLKEHPPTVIKRLRLRDRFQTAHKNVVS